MLRLNETGPEWSVLLSVSSPYQLGMYSSKVNMKLNTGRIWILNSDSVISRGITS